MSRQLQQSNSKKQLRWVILLLAVAVILPTVCLLWFMTQAVKNERLAVKEKLAAVYEERLAGANQKTNEVLSQRYRFLNGKESGEYPYQTFISAVAYEDYDGLLIYDSAGKCVYPLLGVDIDTSVESAEGFAEAWKLEFGEQEFAQAAKVYEGQAKLGNDSVRLAAIIGKSRCLAKSGRLNEAIDECKKAAFSPLENEADSKTLVLIGNARLLLMKFAEADAKYAVLFSDTFNKLISMIYHHNEGGAALPAEYNLFLAQKVFEIREEKLLFDAGIAPIHTHLKEFIAAEELSIRVAENLPTAASLESRQLDSFRRLHVGAEVVYALPHKTNNETLLFLLSGENIASTLSNYEDNFKDSDIAYRILDDSGSFIAGVAAPEGEPFITGSVGDAFYGWKTELYFKDGNIFKKTAERRVALYTWGGALVIVLILVSGGFAAQTIGRQIKLNRLKNDFIATVTHELKTPLSSMRVLVDTLVEGNYNDQQQASEYLQLISKENIRLSRLIDNFLTFSRMERNKQAFDIVSTDPVEIAKAAAEAVQTEFNKGKCKFEIGIDENIPRVLADKDAMVTVLVNLLDNAYKYTYDNKIIELRAFEEGNVVCFLVKDNGIGMNRKVTKRIFNRFYQVDSSLSRQAEGTGLGLSIVKFIVDAHKGQINVESQPGEGSEFVVKLSIVGK